MDQKEKLGDKLRALQKTYGWKAVCDAWIAKLEPEMTLRAALGAQGINFKSETVPGSVVNTPSKDVIAHFAKAHALELSFVYDHSCPQKDQFNGMTDCGKCCPFGGNISWPKS
jgi:hypothetical protein